jgi:hypothetical protein
MMLLARRTDFLDVETREQGVQCRLLQTPPTPQPVVRPGAEVTGVQRLTASPTPPGILAMEQMIPQIPLYSFGRGRGAILIAQMYNHQLMEHYLQYQAHQAQQQQQYLEQQQQLQQFQQHQQQIDNELADLPELIPIQDNFEDIDED